MASDQARSGPRSDGSTPGLADDLDRDGAGEILDQIPPCLRPPSAQQTVRQLRRAGSIASIALGVSAPISRRTRTCATADR